METGLIDQNTPHRLQKGWQVKHDNIMGRLNQLFNCYTMSDIMFHVGNHVIPAHRFILASASPVFYVQLFESCNLGSETSSKMWQMQVMDDGLESHFQNPPQASVNHPLHVEVKFEYPVFYQFVRFLYTNEVFITLANVVALMFMSDDFKVPSLSERCFKFLRSELSPVTLLKILAVNRLLLFKTYVNLWRGVIDLSKAMACFKDLTQADRQRRLAELKEKSSRSASASRRTTQTISLSEISVDDIQSLAPSEASSRLSFRSEDTASVGYQSEKWYSEVKDLSDAYKLLDGDRNLAFLSNQNLYIQLGSFVSQLEFQIDLVLREQTDAALHNEEWCILEARTVRRILSLDTCNVQEIVLFRALVAWAHARCAERKLPPLPEFLRKVLGRDLIELIRFPLISLEDLQWEVVPSGVLDHDDVQRLTSRLRGREGVMTHFNAEPRFFPTTTFYELRRRKYSKERVTNPVHLPQTPQDPKAAPGAETTAPKDDIDAVLRAKLWRVYLEDNMDEQGEAGIAHEAGVPVEVDIRPVLCGDPMKDAKPIRSWTAPWDKPYATSRAHQERMLLHRRTKPSAITLQGKPSTAPAVMQTPRRPSKVHGQPMQTPQFKGVTTMQDFVRLSEGLYWFRGASIVDVWLEHGSPLVYEHPAHVHPSMLNSVAMLEGMEDADLREYFGISKPNPNRGQPLSVFLQTWTGAPAEPER